MYKNSLEYITLKKTEIVDFAQERNDLLFKSNADWLFFVDSDEKLSGTLRANVKKAIQSNKYDGYYVYRKNYFLGRYVGKDKILRLAKRTKGRWVRSVHETWKVGERIGILDGYVIHNTAKDLRSYLSKIDYYSDLHALANQKEGKRSSIFKIIFYPPAKFIQNLFKSGNVVFSIMQSLHSFLSWSKLYLSYS